MAISFKNSLVALLVIFAACLSGWSVFLSSKAPKIAVKNRPNLPDAFMENIVATVMNKAGKPVLKVETPSMVHYPQDDVAELTTPHVTLYRDSPEPWHINAKHAKTQHGTAEITFWDDVVIHHLADTDNPHTTMRTDALTVLPEQHIAKTTAAITVKQPDATVQAIGMLANWEQGTVQLLSQAREEYAPQTAS